MISREEKLSIQKQVCLLRLSRSSFYYRPRAVSEADLMLMRQIDELHLFAGKVWAMDISYSTPSQRISAERRCAA